MDPITGTVEYRRGRQRKFTAINRRNVMPPVSRRKGGRTIKNIKVINTKGVIGNMTPGPTLGNNLPILFREYYSILFDGVYI